MEYFDLGVYSMKVTTSSREAQTWFDRGLIWVYAYNHEEAILCFEKALDADPNCAMAYWGIAYAIGPNYNKPWEAFEEDEKPDCITRALQAITKARELQKEISDKEAALIEAVALRYPKDASLTSMHPGTMPTRARCAPFMKSTAKTLMFAVCLQKRS